MPKACMEKQMKKGMTKVQARKICYPKTSKMIETGKKYGLIKEMEPPSKPTKKTAKRRKGGKLGRDY
jgi:hypothetical protein